MNNDTMKMSRKVLRVRSELAFIDGKKMRSYFDKGRRRFT